MKKCNFYVWWDGLKWFLWGKNNRFCWEIWIFGNVVGSFIFFVVVINVCYFIFVGEVFIIINFGRYVSKCS